MLKQILLFRGLNVRNQPPLGGCVLKRLQYKKFGSHRRPAAFRRLCVETSDSCDDTYIITQPPLGGCVLKPVAAVCLDAGFYQPPLGGCVLKL